jgi:predicted 3-demethylubiquinone-9 3-methyltransferase (glyoxalase superfamily)
MARGGPAPKGTVMTVTFELDGQQYMGLNGGPVFTLSPAISFVVNCDTQDELDRMWDGLSADGGKILECGWLTDKFGVSWQVVPSKMGQWVSDADPARSNRVMAALMKMKKLDIATMQRAYDGQ